jgi:hypothetical protein
VRVAPEDLDLLRTVCQRELELIATSTA